MDILLQIRFDDLHTLLINPVPINNLHGVVSATCPICREAGALAAGESDQEATMSFLSIYCLCEPREILDALGLTEEKVVPTSRPKPDNGETLNEA